MHIFKSEPCFNRRTGKKEGTELQETSNRICDYTGEIILDEFGEETPMYTLLPYYNNDAEEVWYEDSGRRTLEKKYNFDYGDLFKTPFVFKVYPGRDFEDASVDLVTEWLAHREAKKDYYFAECRSVEEAMRLSRVRVVKRLLESGKQTIASLGLTPID